MTFLIVCGGSAGHINPAIAIAEEFRTKLPDSDILFVGSDKKLEKKLIPEAGFNIVNIRMTGLKRSFKPTDLLYNLNTLKNIITAKSKSKKLLETKKPDAVIGTGGSLCYPVIKMASKLKIPSYILEPNAYPGLAVKMVSGVVDNVFVTYKGFEDRYKKPERVIYTGTPVRKGFLEVKENIGGAQQGSKQTVLSYWGSMGAANMNNIIADVIVKNIREQKFNHIHAAGVSGGLELIKKRLQENGKLTSAAPVADIREYIDDMPSVMRKADLIISRAGASTIAELAATGKPAILIPSPNVTENHQEENAKIIQAAGGAVMILEKECTGETLYSKIVSILEDNNELEKMSLMQKSLSVITAASTIFDIVNKKCSENK